jgi:hypothetical protein
MREKKKPSKLIYLALIAFELIVITVMQNVYDKKIDKLENVSTISIEDIVSVEEVDRKDELVQNNLSSVRTDGYYYVCTVSLSNHSTDDTYTPYLRASSTSDDYLDINTVDYFDNAYDIDDYDNNERIPPLTTMDKKYVIYSDVQLTDLTVSVYDYYLEAAVSSASTVLE